MLYFNSGPVLFVYKLMFIFRSAFFLTIVYCSVPLSEFIIIGFREIESYRILILERRQVGLSLLSERILRLKLKKTSWKFIFFGRGKVLAAYLLRVLMDPLFQPSVPPRVISNGKFFFFFYFVSSFSSIFI